jgi:hypothetical protein
VKEKQNDHRVSGEEQSFPGKSSERAVAGKLRTDADEKVALFFFF